MASGTIKSSDSILSITIDRSKVSEDIIREILRLLRLEELIGKADFEATITDIGDDIKSAWWAENKGKFTLSSKNEND